jgi:hypothetical protein
MNTSEVVSHSQVLLTGYIQIFLSLFPHVKSTFRRDDVESLGNVLLSCVQVMDLLNSQSVDNQATILRFDSKTIS